MIHEYSIKGQGWGKLKILVPTLVKAKEYIKQL
jgi:hypothetical protein